MAKIAFIGAGSAVFARALLYDLLTFPEFHSATIHLMDIDADRFRDRRSPRRRCGERLADDMHDDRPPRSPPGRRLRDQHDPGRRLRPRHHQ